MASVSAPASASSAPELRISQTLTVGRASLVLAAMIALSRVTGFGRLILVSTLYGRTDVTDAYNAAFNIPDTISILIAGGALATGFVPVFTTFVSRGEHEAARRTFRALFSLLFVVFGVVTLLLFALTWSSWGQNLALRTGQARPETLPLYLLMLRVLLMAQFVFVLGGVFAGTLNALRLFWYPALQPVAFNGGIIVGGLLGPKLGMGIESQAWGALCGAIIGTLLIQMPATARAGLSLRPLWDLHDAGVRRVLKSLGPIVFGLASGQIIALNLPRFFAGSLAKGDLTALDNANRLMQVPLDLLASGAAIALFPTLSLLASQGNTDELRLQLSQTLRRVLLLILGATALLMALGTPLIHLLLEHGKFGPHDTRFTAQVLWVYGGCLCGLGAQQLLARGFYALGEVRAPVVLGVGAVGIFCVLAWLSVHFTHLGAPGLAGAAAIAVSVLALGMWLSLRARLGSWDDGATLRILGKGLMAAVPAYLLAWSAQRFGLAWIESHGFDSPSTAAVVKLVARAVVLILGAMAGGGVFLLVAKGLGAMKKGKDLT